MEFIHPGDGPGGPIIVDPKDKPFVGVEWRFSNGETVTSAVWNVPASLTKTEESHNDTVTKVKLSGFVDGNDYIVSCTMTDSLGQDTDRGMVIQCRDL